MVLSPILSHESVSESGIAYADGGFLVKDVSQSQMEVWIQLRIEWVKLVNEI